MDETRASARFFSSTRVGFAHNNIRERSSTSTDPRPDPPPPTTTEARARARCNFSLSCPARRVTLPRIVIINKNGVYTVWSYGRDSRVLLKFSSRWSVGSVNPITRQQRHQPPPPPSQIPPPGRWSPINNNIILYRIPVIISHHRTTLLPNIGKSERTILFSRHFLVSVIIYYYIVFARRRYFVSRKNNSRTARRIIISPMITKSSELLLINIIIASCASPIPPDNRCAGPRLGVKPFYTRACVCVGTIVISIVRKTHLPANPECHSVIMLYDNDKGQTPTILRPFFFFFHTTVLSENRPPIEFRTFPPFKHPPFPSRPPRRGTVSNFVVVFTAMIS